MFEIRTLPFGLLSANCHLIILPSATCLIDPCVRPELLPIGLPPINWIIATHGHYDHINQADALRTATGAPLFIHQDDGDCLNHSIKNLSFAMQRSTMLRPAERFLQDGQLLDLSDGYQIEVIQTSGHTKGGICLLLMEGAAAIALFTGDTLFAGSIGRTDLDGNAVSMRDSLNKLRQLGKRFGGQNIPVFPGHGSATELRAEIEGNPYFQHNYDASLNVDY